MLYNMTVILIIKYYIAIIPILINNTYLATLKYYNDEYVFWRIKV